MSEKQLGPAEPTASPDDTKGGIAMHKPTNKLTTAMSVADVMVVATPAKEAIFSEWMDAELEKLVAKWIHLAAPNATRARERRSSR